MRMFFVGCTFLFVFLGGCGNNCIELANPNQTDACENGPNGPMPSPTPTPVPGPMPGPTPGPTPAPTPGPTPAPTPGPTPGTGKSYHVSANGNNDSGNGSAEAPWGTIGRAVTAADPGDVIVLHNGVYRESVRIREPSITIMSAEGEWGVIESAISDANGPQFGVMFDVDASKGVLKRVEVVGGYYCVFMQTRWDWGEANRGGASDILIEDCKIHESGRDCIKITPNSDRITIRRCEIYNSGKIYPPGTPFDNKNAEGIDDTNADGVLVQDCDVHDTATTGLYFKGGATNCVVERTRISRCGQAGVLLGFDTSPEFFDTAVNPGYYECIGGVVRNCIIEDTDYAGIGVYAAYGAIVANNTVVNTAKAGHSPIYFGITLQDYDPNAGRPASKDVQVFNNVVCQLQAIEGPMVLIRYLDELGGLAALQGMPAMNNNLYYRTSGEVLFRDNRPGSMLNAALSAWQTHINGERASFVANPLLSADYHLTAQSPAIDKGTALNTVADDFDREPRAKSAGFDIGADEF